MAHRKPATRMVRPLRQLPAVLGLAIAAVAVQVVPAEFPRDIHEWTPPAKPGPPAAVRERTDDRARYPDLECDPDLLIWKRYCPDCISNRPLEHCSDAALR